MRIWSALCDDNPMQCSTIVFTSQIADVFRKYFFARGFDRENEHSKSCCSTNFNLIRKHYQKIPLIGAFLKGKTDKMLGM